MPAIDQHLLAALMDNIPDMIYFKDTKGHFISVSRAMMQYFGVASQEEIMGKTDFDFFLHEHAQQAYDDEQKVISTGQAMVAKIEFELLPDGRKRWVSTTKIPLRDEMGNITGTCGISRDVTEQYDQAEKLREYAQALADKQNQMEEELAFAREIQMALLPQEYPVFPKGVSAQESALAFSHRYLPTTQVGGDFFTILPISDTQAGVLICDVMGHGVHAALVTVMQRIFVEELQPWSSNPGVFLGQLNRRLRAIFQRVETPLFVTAFYAVIDSANGALRFANAGHPLPLRINRLKGEVKRLGAAQKETTFPLAMMEDAVYMTQRETFSVGDLLFLFTDGLCDIEDKNGERFEDKAFVSIVRNCAQLRGEAFLDAVAAEVKAASGPEGFEDDVCMLGIEYQYQTHHALE
ncbi:MAG: SpoIIE family protein phosphatase [Methylacidiphilales bacterium]|nr:SpoIIE family protein phosphatase [Candidatus Methylacidiphilales bacterium]